MTDEQIESNYLEANARRIANWLAGHRDLSGMQRAILASLGQAITEALQGEDAQPEDAPP